MKENSKKQIFRTLMMLSVPTVLEQIFSTLLQYVDTAMVGHLGEQATAAVSVSTSINWLINSIAGAIGVAVLAMISKAVGAKEEERIREISSQAVLAILACGGILTAVTLAVSPYMPVWMGAEPAVQKEAAKYFFIISCPMIFRAAGIICGSAIRATQDTQTPMFINMGANILNAVLNYLLMYVLHMGVTGAAAATAVSYVTAGTLMFAAFRRSQVLHWKRENFRFRAEIMREGLSLSLPVLGTSFVSCMGYVVFTGMVSSMGTTIFAAHAIAVAAEEIFYIPGYGLRTATSALVGGSLGEGNKRKFEIVSYESIFLTVGMMCLSGVVLYLTAYPLMCLFTNSAEAALLGSQMLKLVAFSEPFFGLMIVMEGIFYGLGRTRYAFFVESFSMWGIRIAATFICVMVLHLGLTEVWYCMIADNVCKALLLSIPMVRKKYRDNLFPAAAGIQQER